MTNVKKWYENSYKNSGFKAQRRYPNEELLRFLGVNFFNNDVESRKKIKVLEVGCGSCANLWMVAKEGFDAYGLDISHEALKLGEQMLNQWQVNADLKQGSFLELPYKDESFDVVIDVVSMSSVNHNEMIQGLGEVHRVLKKNGLFFSYENSQDSSVFRDYLPARKLDEYTLNGIYREGSPLVGNHYPLHFWKKEDYIKTLNNINFDVEYMERVRKEYFEGREYMEYLSSYARRK